MVGGIFQIIKKAFRRTAEPASTMQSEKFVAPLSVPSGDAPSRQDDGSVATNYSSESYEESPTLEAIIAPPDVPEFAKLVAQNAFAVPEGPFDPHVRLVDASLVNRVVAHRIDLNRIDIAMLGLPSGTVNILKTAHMTTLAQLANCSRTDLLRVRSIGITKVDQIGKAMNSFLVGLLPKTEQKTTMQASYEPNVNPTLIDQNVDQELSELVKNLSHVFQAKVPVCFIRLIPNLWDDLDIALGKEPKSFLELGQSAQKTEGSLSHGPDNGSMERHLASKRVTQWLKRATKHDCIDEEIEYVVSSLNERERTILAGRYKTDSPLTLEAIGQQLGITRERVRQIQAKVQRKLVTRIKQSTFLYSTAALYILKTQGEDASLANWTKQLVDDGFLKDTKYLDMFIAVARATNSRELVLPEEFTQSLETHISKRILAATKSVVAKARKMCRNCGAVRALSLVDEKASEEDVEQILRLNHFAELHPGWWTRDTGESVPERVGAKVITYCGPVSPATMRYALRRHLSRFQLPSPPSKVLAKLLEQKGSFIFNNGLIQLAKVLNKKPSLTGPEKVFLNMVLEDGPIVSFEAVHHALLEAGLSTGSVTSVLKYSPIVHKVSVALYSLLGAKYDEIDVQEAQAQLTRISADSTLKVRSDGVIEFETNAGTWLEYGGVLSSGPARALKGDWRLIISSTESGQLVVDGYFIRGLSQVSKSLSITPGDRIRIEFNTWTREAKMIKVVKNG
jgi:RNA polymerase sigma factor (sigma-70 family)